MQIRWRLTIFNALAIGLILVLLGLGLFLLLRNALYSDIQETVENQAIDAASILEDGGDLRNDAAQLTPNGGFVVVRDGRGNILSRAGEFPGEESIRDEVWRRALNTGEAVSGAVEVPDREGSDYVYAVPVTPPPDSSLGTARVVEAGKSSQGAEDTLEAFNAILAIGIGAAFILSLAGAYLLARTALRPVETVVSSAREITEGDLGKRLPVSNPGDEIGRLANTINELLARLEGAFARREEALTRQRRFAADASHELRTPLTSISGYARMLDEWGLKDPNVARESIAAIRGEADRLRTLAESLLALTKGDEGPPMEVENADLTFVAAGAVETARAVAGEKIRVEYAPPGHSIEAEFDRARIRQATSILLDNAIKYTMEGGRSLGCGA